MKSIRRRPERRVDRIEGDHIVLHDDAEPGTKILKRVIILRSNGRKDYVIRRTKNDRYLFQ